MPLPIKKPLPDGRGSDWRIATLIGAATVRERFFLSKSPSLARKPQIRVVTAFDLAGCAGNEAMKKKPIDTPKFVNEAEEADWWASREGREFVKRKSVGPPKKGSDLKGSRLVGQLNRTSSVQIALRLPGPE